MSQKLAKKIRRRLRDESALVFEDLNGKTVPMIKERKLVKRKDPNSFSVRGELPPMRGLMNHPYSERSVYQKLKKRKSDG